MFGHIGMADSQIEKCVQNSSKMSSGRAIIFTPHELARVYIFKNNNGVYRRLNLLGRLFRPFNLAKIIFTKAK